MMMMSHSPVPFSNFEFTFDPAISEFYPSPHPPPHTALPSSADLFSQSETTDVLGFLDNFNWQFDADPMPSRYELPEHEMPPSSPLRALPPYTNPHTNESPKPSTSAAGRVTGLTVERPRILHMPSARCMWYEKCGRSSCAFIHPDSPDWDKAPPARRRVYNTPSRAPPASSSSKNSAPRTSVPSAWGDQGATSNRKRKRSEEADTPTRTTGGWGAGSKRRNTGASGWGARSSRDTGSKAADSPAAKTHSTGWGSTSSGRGDKDYSASPWGSAPGWGEASADDSNSGWNTTPAVPGNQSSGDWGSGQKSREDTLDTTMQLPPAPPTPVLPAAPALVSQSLPPLDLTNNVFRVGQFPSATGGFADVWKGEWHDAGGKQHQVAIKVLRAYMDDPAKQLKLQKRLRRELCIWQRLKHKNVLALHGIASHFGPHPGFVCPWLENGCISKYLIKRGADLRLSHRLQLLCEVAAGLSYLHASGVVHGDLTGANILIADDGSACLCDFGLSSIATEFLGTSYNTSTMGGNVRWAAPELLCVAKDGKVPKVNTHSDAYSYGSVALEILSGQVPFPDVTHDPQIIMQLFSGVKSPRPATPYVTDQLWAFINQCWADVPTERPAAEHISQSMQRFLNENTTEH